MDRWHIVFPVVVVLLLMSAAFFLIRSFFVPHARQADCPFSE